MKRDRMYMAVLGVGALIGSALLPIQRGEAQGVSASLSARVKTLEQQVVALQKALNAEAAARQQGDADTLAAARGYTEYQSGAEAAARLKGDAATLAAATGYTDDQIGAEVAARKKGDAATLESARFYTESLVNPLKDKLQYVRVEDTDMYIEGANLHIRNGLGAIATLNGLGNLIVGYNDLRPSGNDRSGSHNIVVGGCQNYSSYGGLVAGRFNTVAAPFASVSGGYNNTASGAFSSVSGGSYNEASHLYASISGGFQNTASADSSSVSGGALNTASGARASVSGGYNNTASESFASVSGGRDRTANGGYDWRAGEYYQDN
ncbi:MAG: hypothetical protein IT210_09490 [Armatimonadetes bacterium]|nr:hypothetical protein [Armatimonadota bacterium]